MTAFYKCDSPKCIKIEQVYEPVTLIYECGVGLGERRQQVRFHFCDAMCLVLFMHETIGFPGTFSGRDNRYTPPSVSWPESSEYCKVSDDGGDEESIYGEDTLYLDGVGEIDGFTNG